MHAQGTAVHISTNDRYPFECKCIQHTTIATRISSVRNVYRKQCIENALKNTAQPISHFSKYLAREQRDAFFVGRLIWCLFFFRDFFFHFSGFSFFCLFCRCWLFSFFCLFEFFAFSRLFPLFSTFFCLSIIFPFKNVKNFTFFDRIVSNP